MAVEVSGVGLGNALKGWLLLCLALRAKVGHRCVKGQTTRLQQPLLDCPHLV
jgi:hypothetical protein